MTPSIILDSIDTKITYGPSQLWKILPDKSAFSGTYSVCNESQANSSTGTPFLSYSFYGSGIDIYGNPGKGLKMNYTLDNSSTQQGLVNTTRSQSVNTGFRLWGLKGLDNSTYHTVNLTITAGEAIIDYIVVNPSPNPPYGFSGENLIYDSSDIAIHYSGESWSGVAGGSFAGGKAYGTFASVTNKPGDKFAIGFVGSEISVYGLLNYQRGKLGYEYTIDGRTPTLVIPFTGSQAINVSKWDMNYKLLEQSVEPGRHTLEVTMQQITGSQEFWLDYITITGINSTTLAGVEPIVTSSTNTNKPFSSKALGGAIVGGIIGLSIAFMVWKLFARHKGKKVIVDGNILPPYSQSDPIRNAAPVIPAAPRPETPHYHGVSPARGWEPPTAPPPPDALLAFGDAHTGSMGVFPVPQAASVHTYPPTPLSQTSPTSTTPLYSPEAPVIHSRTPSSPFISQHSPHTADPIPVPPTHEDRHADPPPAYHPVT